MGKYKFVCLGLGLFLSGCGLNQKDLDSSVKEPTNNPDPKKPLIDPAQQKAVLIKANLEYVLNNNKPQAGAEGRLLESVDLSLKSLSNTDLDGCLLSKANFDSTKLSHVSFKGAHLGDATFNAAQITPAYFQTANMTNAQLRNIKAIRSFFNQANLSNADFEGSDLSASDFTEADLSGTKFKDTNLFSVRLDQAKISGTDFRGAYMEGFWGNISLGKNYIYSIEDLGPGPLVDLARPPIFSPKN